MSSIHILFSHAPGENCCFDLLFFKMKAWCSVLGVEVGGFGTGVVGRGRPQRLVKTLSVVSILGCSLTVSNTTGKAGESKGDFAFSLTKARRPIAS